MIYLLQNFSFSFSRLIGLLLNCEILFQRLHCIKFFVVLLLYQIHLAKRATTNDFQDLEVLLVDLARVMRLVVFIL